LLHCPEAKTEPAWAGALVEFKPEASARTRLFSAAPSRLILCAH
jgi:hypothetical protein